MSLFKTLRSSWRNQGLRYVIYRSFYELRRKLGLLAIQFPSSPIQKKHLTFQEWKNLNIPFFFSGRRNLKMKRRPRPILEKDFNDITSGKVRFFNNEWKHIEGWLTNVSTGYKYDINRHWTKIEDLSSSDGDIKYVWEKSRFTFLNDIIRYDHHFEKNNSEFVFNQIESWIDSNPINMGPNYKCSQEISIRCLNWIWAIYFYSEDTALHDDRWQKVIQSIYWQIRHVYSNINFSRYCVRNNNAIKESLFLYVSGLLFPFFRESQSWKTNGKKCLEEEINYQIYEDGSYLQFSHNYQRVLVQLMTWTVSISEVHNEVLQEKTLLKIRKLVKYMDHCCVGSNGELPNYGNNDGALFFKLTNQSYNDFRPQINALNYALSKSHIYNNEDIQEEARWYGSELDRLENIETSVNQKETAIRIFPEGGIATITDRRDASFTFLKCAKYRDRPGQADNMHLDIWIDGNNYLRDSGTYKYNTSEELIQYFAGTAGHNTVMVEGHNQMTKGPRFIWDDWTRKASLQKAQDSDTYILFANAEMFYSLGKPVEHNRKVVKKSPHHWLVIDKIPNKRKQQTMTQLWHVNPEFSENLTIKSIDESGNELELILKDGHWSAYYGTKEKAPVWCFSSEGNEFRTEIKIEIK